MSIQPTRPEHGPRDYPVTGASERFSIRRTLVGYSYPANGNVHNPTPRFRWLLLVDGKIADSSSRKGSLVAAAREHGPAYLAEFPRLAR
jgi:hypothetical protein